MADELDRDYETLGLKFGASPEQIRQAYWDLAKVWHPDRFPNNVRLQQKAQEKLKEINGAYERLRSQELRPPLTARQFKPISPLPGPSRPGAHHRSWGPPPPSSAFRSPKRHRLTGPIFIAVFLVLLIYALSGPWPASLPKRQQEAGQPDRLGVLQHRDEFPDQLAASQGTISPASSVLRYFTLGSTREEVLEIQGVPDEVSQDFAHYGTSEVLFKNGRVVGWTNLYPRLKVQLLPADPASLSHFTLGSTKDEVLAAQGTPDHFTSDSFHYGTSQVFFENGRVTNWNNSFPRLKVQVLPANPTSVSHFTFGSTKDEVLAVQGAPDHFTSDSFHYGTSEVFFQNGRVVGWKNIYPRLRVQGRS